MVVAKCAKDVKNELYKLETHFVKLFKNYESICSRADMKTIDLNHG
jgi:hypothetical protein